MDSLKHLKYLLISFILCFGNSGKCAIKTLNLPEGSICTDSRYNSSIHICQKINDCQPALQDLRQSIRPVICSFNAVEGSNPIVCCRQVKTYTAAEKCLEYSKLVYVEKKSLMLYNPNNETFKVKDCLNVQPLITGGNQAQSKEFPHMALIGYHKSMDSMELWFCGGSLISFRWVLSAAHCNKVQKALIPRFIRLGQLNYRNPNDVNKQDFEIKERVLHPNYKPSLSYNDIALFRLDRDITPTPFVRPICLHTEKSIPANQVVATGWGRTEAGDSQSLDLLKVTLDIMPVTQCNSTYFNKDRKKLPMGVVDENMVCAGTEETGKDTCNGDSGGPIQIPHPNKKYDCMYSQVGITSFGQLSCGVGNTAAVYTRVSAYIPWIESTVWPIA